MYMYTRVYVCSCILLCVSRKYARMTYTYNGHLDYHTLRERDIVGYLKCTKRTAEIIKDDSTAD